MIKQQPYLRFTSDVIIIEDASPVTETVQCEFWLKSLEDFTTLKNQELIGLMIIPIQNPQLN